MTSENNPEQPFFLIENEIFNGTEWVPVNRIVKHGSYATYTNQHCRCDLCREAHNNWHRQYRSSGGGHARTLLANRRSRKIQQEATAYLKQHHPAVYEEIVARVHQELADPRG